MPFDFICEEEAAVEGACYGDVAAYELIEAGVIEGVAASFAEDVGAIVRLNVDAFVLAFGSDVGS